MAAPKTPLDFTIAPSFNPMSGTGSDIHEPSSDIIFGDISVGGGRRSDAPWWESAARDIAVALCVALAARVIWERMLK